MTEIRKIIECRQENQVGPRIAAGIQDRTAFATDLARFIFGVSHPILEALSIVESVIDILGGEPMPGRKHVRGVSAKEQRQYEHIKESSEKSGRYGKRAAEVAARTVLKQHKEKGHSKGK
jgi:hypothetical protein